MQRSTRTRGSSRWGRRRRRRRKIHVSGALIGLDIGDTSTLAWSNTSMQVGSRVQAPLSVGGCCGELKSLLRSVPDTTCLWWGVNQKWLRQEDVEAAVDRVVDAFVCYHGTSCAGVGKTLQGKVALYEHTQVKTDNHGESPRKASSAKSSNRFMGPPLLDPHPLPATAGLTKLPLRHV